MLGGGPWEEENVIVFWTGWGILALFIPFICFPLVIIGVIQLTGSFGHWDEAPGQVGSAWMASGLVCWVVGRFLNSRKPRVGDVRKSHTFMFMEMQWTGVVYGLIGGWYLVKSLLA